MPPKGLLKNHSSKRIESVNFFMKLSITYKEKINYSLEYARHRFLKLFFLFHLEFLLEKI